MRIIRAGYFYRVLVVVGILLLIGLVSADIWLWQRDDGPGQAAGAGQGAQDAFEAPGLPARSTTSGADNGDGGPASSGATVSDSAELEIQRGGAAAGEVETIQIEEASGTGPELTAAEGATANDAPESEVKQEETPPPSGGPGDAAEVEDSADLVVRDAAGNIKKQEAVK